MNKETTKLIPGDELHLTMLMAPYSLNLVTGQDRQHLLAFGRAAFDAGKNTGHASEPVASMLTFVNGKPAKCGCRFSYSDGGGEYSDVGSVTLCAKHAGTERNGIERAEPFMWAIQEPGGGAYMDEGCVSSVREDVQAEVDGLNSGLDADDDPYQVVPVYLAAAPQAVQAAEPEGWKLVPIKVPDSAFAWVSGGYPAGFKAGDKRDTAVVHERAQRTWEAILNGITAPAHPAEGVPAQCPNINEPRGCWRVACQLGGKCREPERSATQPAAQGMEQDAARYHWLRKSPNPACDIALAKHFGGGRGQDFDALIDAAIAAQAKQGGA